MIPRAKPQQTAAHLRRLLRYRPSDGSLFRSASWSARGIDRNGPTAVTVRGERVYAVRSWSNNGHRWCSVEGKQWSVANLALVILTGGGAKLHRVNGDGMDCRADNIVAVKQAADAYCADQVDIVPDEAGVGWRLLFRTNYGVLRMSARYATHADSEWVALDMRLRRIPMPERSLADIIAAGLADGTVNPDWLLLD